MRTQSKASAPAARSRKVRGKDASPALVHARLAGPYSAMVAEVSGASEHAPRKPLSRTEETAHKFILPSEGSLQKSLLHLALASMILYALRPTRSKMKMLVYVL